MKNIEIYVLLRILYFILLDENERIEMRKINEFVSFADGWELFLHSKFKHSRLKSRVTIYFFVKITDICKICTKLSCKQSKI